MLLTEREAAVMAKVSIRTLRRLIQRGKLPALNYGTEKRKSYRINSDDLLGVQPVENPLSARPPARKPPQVEKTVWPPGAASRSSERAA